MREKKYLQISRRLAFNSADKVFEHLILVRGLENAASRALRLTLLFYNCTTET